MDTSRAPGIVIEQVFLERALFEHREDFLSFPAVTRVNSQVDLTLDAALSPDGKQGRVRLIVSTKTDDPGLYRFACTMTALLATDEATANLPLPQYVSTNTWGLLFPFVREVVANLTARGRFGPVWLRPVNFVALSNQGAVLSAQAVSEPTLTDTPTAAALTAVASDSTQPVPK